jgi:hypothetical protein
MQSTVVHSILVAPSQKAYNLCGGLQGASGKAVDVAVFYNAAAMSVDVVVRGHCGPGAEHAVTLTLPDGTLVDTAGGSATGRPITLPCTRLGAQGGTVARNVVLFAAAIFVAALAAGVVATVLAACGVGVVRGARLPSPTALGAATVSLFLLGEFSPLYSFNLCEE